MRLLWLLIVIACTLSGCTRTDPDKCERAIRNYAKLVFWDDAEKEIAAAPADQREQLRKDKAIKFERDMERGLNLEVSKCTSANFSDKVDCMLAAKTAKQAKDCTAE